MCRYAIWGRRPEDPRTVWGYLFWNGTRSSRSQRRTVSLAILVVLVAVFSSSAIDGAIAAIVGLLGLIGVVVLAAHYRPGSWEHAALPTLGEEESFPVGLDIITRGGTRLGQEVGWVAFTEGWLVYEGMRTSFSLRPCDFPATSKIRRGSAQIRFADGTTVRLTLLTDPMLTRRPARWRDGSRMRDAFQAWRNGPSPSGEPVLPPRESSLIVVGNHLGFALILMLVLLAAAIALGAAQQPVGAGVTFAVALLCAFCLVFGGSQFKRRLMSVPVLPRTDGFDGSLVASEQDLRSCPREWCKKAALP